MWRGWRHLAHSVTFKIKLNKKWTECEYHSSNGDSIRFFPDSQNILTKLYGFSRISLTTKLIPWFFQGFSDHWSLSVTRLNIQQVKLCFTDLMKHSFFKVNILYELEGEISYFSISFRLKNKTLWLLFGSSLKNQQLEINKNKMSFPKKDSKPEFYLTWRQQE